VEAWFEWFRHIDFSPAGWDVVANRLVPQVATIGIALEVPVVGEVIMAGYVIYGVSKLYTWLNTNPAVKAPWKTFQELEDELTKQGTKWTYGGNDTWLKNALLGASARIRQFIKESTRPVSLI